jgi:hypothetical protein
VIELTRELLLRLLKLLHFALLLPERHGNEEGWLWLR